MSENSRTYQSRRLILVIVGLLVFAAIVVVVPTVVQQVAHALTPATGVCDPGGATVVVASMNLGESWLYPTVAGTALPGIPPGFDCSANNWTPGPCRFTAPTTIGYASGAPVPDGYQTYTCPVSPSSSTVADNAPMDPPGAPPRVWGGHDTDPSSHLIVYGLPYGFQFYAFSGQPLGVVDLNTVGIPGPGGMITSMTTDGFRVDLFYTGGDQLRADLYEGGALTAQAYFSSPGIGRRAGEVPGQPVPGSGGFAVASAAGAIGVSCPQNLRQYPSMDSAVLLIVPPGSSLTLIGRSNDSSWLQVTTSDAVTGWLFNGRCINAGGTRLQSAPIEIVFENQPTVEEVVQAPAPQPISVPTQSFATIGITCHQNMRTGPGMDFAVDRVLPPGTTMDVVGRTYEAAWLQVSGNGASGWVYFGECVVPQQGDVTSAPVTIAMGG